MKKQLPQQKGFVILFTILISTIILMIGLGIFSIATRETVLSGTAREAQYAFYAADAGIECALYAQSLGAAGPIALGSSGGGSLVCGDIPVSIIGDGIYPGNPYIFNIVVDTEQKTCATVTVFDTFTNLGTSRRIISQGYNICYVTTGEPLTKNPILVERDLDTLFQIGASGTPLLPSNPIPVGSFKPVDPNILNGTTILGGQ